MKFKNYESRKPVFDKENPDLGFLPCSVMIIFFRTERSRQTVQTQIRLFLVEQSDQGLHCLLLYLRLFDKIPQGLASLFEF